MAVRVDQPRYDPATRDGLCAGLLLQRDPAVAGWSDTTKAKLLQVVLRILAEARYLESTRSLHLTPPLLHPEVQRYLKSRSEAAVLAAMELTH